MRIDTLRNSEAERRDYAVMFGREVWLSARGALSINVGGPGRFVEDETLGRDFIAELDAVNGKRPVLASCDAPQPLISSTY
jgi:hypothetical protein